MAALRTILARVATIRPYHMIEQPPPGTETVLILDFGSQTAQLIARRVREAGVFSLLVSPRITADEIRRRR